MVSLKDLRAEAKEKGVKGYSRLSKYDLAIALGHGAEAGEAEDSPVQRQMTEEPEHEEPAKDTVKERKPSKPNAWREYARSYQAEHKIEKFKDALIAAGPSWQAKKGAQLSEAKA